MSAVLGIWALMLGLIGLGWLAGALMGEGKMRRRLGDEFQAGYDAGYERAKGRYGAMRDGMVQHRTLSRPRVRRVDPRGNRETGGLWS